MKTVVGMPVSIVVADGQTVVLKIDVVYTFLVVVAFTDMVSVVATVSTPVPKTVDVVSGQAETCSVVKTALV